MSDLPPALQRARAEAYARRRVANAEQPPPFPQRGPRQDWERRPAPPTGLGARTGAMVGALRPPETHQVPYEQAAGEPAPFPFSPERVRDPVFPQQNMQQFSQVVDAYAPPLQGDPREAPAGRQGFAPPDAPGQMSVAELDSQRWRDAHQRARGSIQQERREDMRRIPRPGYPLMAQAWSSPPDNKPPGSKQQQRGTLIPSRDLAAQEQQRMRDTSQAAPMTDPATGWPIDPLTGRPVAPIEWERMQAEQERQRREDEARVQNQNRWGVNDSGITFRRRF